MLKQILYLGLKVRTSDTHITMIFEGYFYIEQVALASGGHWRKS